MSRILLLAFALFAIIYTASAHGNHARRSNWRPARAVQSSTCSYMQCAVSGGNCGVTGSSIQFCPAGEHCGSSNKCTADIPLGSACDLNAQENECASGSCVDTGNGPVCQIYQEILPGNPCTADSQCYFSQNADGSGSVASTCDATTKVCAGSQIGQTCKASHQCYVGSFCSSSTMTCQALGQEGASCSSDSECSDRFTCLNSVCSKRYTQSLGQTCESTDNCQPGLYCSTSKTCAQSKTSTASGSQCDISSNSCGADEQCACQGFTTSGQTATCSNIQGTFADMPTIEQSAYSCMDSHNCGSDLGNSTTLSCLSTNCVKEFCTYFTRYNNDLFTDFPMCLVSRMVDNSDYYNLVNTCANYKPTGQVGSSDSENPTSSSDASTVFLSLSLALFVVLASLF